MISHCLCVLTTCVLNIRSVTTKQKLVAVTSLVGSEQFYLRIKRQERPPLTHPIKISPEMKAEICADILASALFNSLYHADPVCKNNKAIYMSLREKHPNIYQHFYHSIEPSSLSRNITSSNPFKLRNVTVDEAIVQEDVFICLARNRVTKNIVEYFISLSYNIANDENYKYDEKRGVFVFEYDQSMKIAVIALAEEPGYVFDHAQDFKIIQYPYNKQVFEEYETKDTICDLTTNQKVRLCTLVLNAEKYRKEVTFLPHESNIQSKCKRRAVKLYYDRNDLNFEHEMENDWMIGCIAKKIRNDESVVYHVSAGSYVYEHFICEGPERENTMLSGITCRVRISKKGN